MKIDNFSITYKFKSFIKGVNLVIFKLDICVSSNYGTKMNFEGNSGILKNFYK